MTNDEATGLGMIRIKRIRMINSRSRCGGGGRMTTNGRCIGRGGDDDKPAFSAEMVLSESEPVILFGFGDKDVTVIVAGYADLVFVVFYQGSILVLFLLILILVHDKYAAATGAKRSFLGKA